MITAHADTIAALVGLGVLLLVFYGPWQNTITDVARQFVFEERDAIFDLAAAGKLSFDSAEYRAARDSMNRLIRFAHELNWFRFFFVYLKCRADGTWNLPSDLTLSLRQIKDEEVLKAIRERVSFAQSSLLAMMALKSIVIFVPFLIVLLPLWLLGCLRAAGRYVTRFTSIGELMQIEAERAT
jgi:hypothetical protein